jgi:hypothetical protein
MGAESVGYGPRVPRQIRQVTAATGHAKFAVPMGKSRATSMPRSLWQSRSTASGFGED